MLPNANMDRRTTEYSTQTALVTSLGFRKPPYSCTQGMFHSPHVHPTSRYVIASDKFYQAFSRVSTQATNARVVTRLGSSHNAVHVNFTSLMVSSLKVYSPAASVSVLCMHMYAMHSLLLTSRLPNNKGEGEGEASYWED